MYSLFLFFLLWWRRERKNFHLKTQRQINPLTFSLHDFVSSHCRKSRWSFLKKKLFHTIKAYVMQQVSFSLTTLTHSRLFIVCLLPFQLCESCIKVANKRGMNKDGGGGRVYLSVNNEWWWPTFWDLLDHIFSMSWHGYMLDKTYAHMKSISTS